MSARTSTLSWLDKFALRSHRTTTKARENAAQRFMRPPDFRQSKSWPGYFSGNTKIGLHVGTPHIQHQVRTNSGGLVTGTRLRRAQVIFEPQWPYKRPEQSTPSANQNRSAPRGPLECRLTAQFHLHGEALGGFPFPIKGGRSD